MQNMNFFQNTFFKESNKIAVEKKSIIDKLS